MIIFQKNNIETNDDGECNFEIFLYIGLVVISIGMIFIFIGLGEQVKFGQITNEHLNPIN